MERRPLRIYTCAEWGARPPRRPILLAAGKPERILFHHTQGHHPELDHRPATETLEESFAYARAIQSSHLSRDGGTWADTGNNFLVTRAGHALEGRHGSIAALHKGRCVVSAHCPGQNDQPGIEHEHLEGEDLTPAQRATSIALMAWIIRHAPTIRPTEIHGHREYYPTSCPTTELQAQLPSLRLAVAHKLTEDGVLVSSLPHSWPWPWRYVLRGRRAILVR